MNSVEELREREIYMRMGEVCWKDNGRWILNPGVMDSEESRISMFCIACGLWIRGSLGLLDASFKAYPNPA